MYSSFRAPKISWLPSEALGSNSPSHCTSTVQNNTANLPSLAALSPSQHYQNLVYSAATPAFTTHENIQIPPSYISGNGSLKRKLHDKENESPRKRAALSSKLHAPAESAPKRNYAPRRTNQQKLESILEAIHNLNWTLADFLYYAFRTTDEGGNKIHRTHQHAKLTSHFLRGHGKFTPAQIIDAWFCTPDGRIASNSPDMDLMYSTATPYTEIKPIRAALTSFAAQVVGKKLVSEVKKAVDVKSGLHATAKKQYGQKVEWSDIGAATASNVAKIFKQHQPLTWHYMVTIAQGPSRKNRRKKADNDNRRPAEMVRELFPLVQHSSHENCRSRLMSFLCSISLITTRLASCH
jgi:hypothetical protein